MILINRNNNNKWFDDVENQLARQTTKQKMLCNAQQAKSNSYEHKRLQVAKFKRELNTNHFYGHHLALKSQSTFVRYQYNHLLNINDRLRPDNAKVM